MTSEKILAAINRLPLKAGVNAEQAAGAMTMTCGFALLNDRRELSATRQKDGKDRELGRFVTRARSLLNHMAKMHGDSTALISQGVRAPAAVADDLKALVGKAEVALKKDLSSPANPSPARLGPQQVADLCALNFNILTGMEPKVGTDRITAQPTGAFYAFVSNVFAALGVRGNAEHYAKAARVKDVIGGAPGVTIKHVKNGETPV